MFRNGPAWTPRIEWLPAGEPEEQQDLKFVNPQALIYPPVPPLRDAPPLHAELTSTGFSLRGVTRADDSFLSGLTVTNRWTEVAPLIDWTLDQKAAFLESQHGIQHLQYLRNYPDGLFMIVEHQGRPIGRLYLHRSEQRTRVVDITLIPEARGRAIGTFLLLSVQEDSARRGLPVQLQVATGNPAGRLYGRLGFNILQSGETHTEMIWRPRHQTVPPLT